MNPLLFTLVSPAHLARRPGWIMRVRPRQGGTEPAASDADF